MNKLKMSLALIALIIPLLLCAKKRNIEFIKHGIRINKKTEKYRLHKQVKTKFPKRLTSLSDKILLLYAGKTLPVKNDSLQTIFLTGKRQHLTDIPAKSKGFSRGNRQTFLRKKKKKPTARKTFVQFFCLFVNSNAMSFCSVRFSCYKIVLYLCAEKNKTNERGFYQTSPLGTDSRRYRYFRSTDYIK